MPSQHGSPWGHNPMASITSFMDMTPEQKQALIQQFRDRMQGGAGGMPGFMQGLFGMGR